MVKRSDIKPGLIVSVTKVPPGPAGPRFEGKLVLHERLEVMSTPFDDGNLHLVWVKRLKTGREEAFVYSFIACFCKPTVKS